MHHAVHEWKNKSTKNGWLGKISTLAIFTIFTIVSINQLDYLRSRANSPMNQSKKTLATTDWLRRLKDFHSEFLAGIVMLLPGEISKLMHWIQIPNMETSCTAFPFDSSRFGKVRPCTMCCFTFQTRCLADLGEPMILHHTAWGCMFASPGDSCRKCA